MAKKGPQVIQNSFLRATKIFASGARVAAREIAGQVSGGTSIATRLKQAQDIVNTLGELKGAAMKAGQILSIDAAQYLPPEVVSVLRQLQDQVTFMPYDQVRYILQRQLGQARFETIENLSIEPIAAASIGQVHKATIDGKPVAIKIQYPGVATSIDSDLKALRKLAVAALKVMGKNIDLTPVLDEITKSLKQEVNYRIEADMIELTRRTMTNPNYVIPEVYRDFSTDTVLTLSFEEGVKISDWMKNHEDKAERSHVTALIVDLLIDEVIATGVVQTDPNFANFLYRPSERKLVLLDFGATWIYGSELREYLQAQTLSLFEGDIDGVMEAIQNRGYLSKKESDGVRSSVRELLEIVRDVASPEAQPLFLANRDLNQKLMNTTQRLGLAIEHTAPPKDLVLIGRKLGGMLSLIREMGTEINLISVKQRLAAVKV